MQWSTALIVIGSIGVTGALSHFLCEALTKRL